MSELRKRNRAANLALNEVLNKLGVLIEARTTSTSGRWVVCIGQQSYKGMPSYCVVCVRLVDLYVRFERFTPADSEESLYEDARREAYDAARALYESIAQQLTKPEQPTEADEPSGMEVVNPDGTKTDGVN